MKQNTTVVYIALLAFCLSLAACSNGPDQNNLEVSENDSAEVSRTAPEISAQSDTMQPKTNPDKITKEGKENMSSTRTALMKTNKGDVKIELDAEKAPLSVANFIEYTESGHYDGTLFHRVIPGFMVQGGGFEPGMKQKPTLTPIDNEANNGLTNLTYTIAMARTNAPHSATSQFFINVSDNDFLNFTSESGSGWGYAVFGKVIEGEEVIKAIEAVETGQAGPHGDVPKEDVVIESMTIID